MRKFARLKKPAPLFINYLGKTIFVFVAWVILFSLFFINLNPTSLSKRLKEKEISDLTVYAPFGFEYTDENGHIDYVRKDELIIEKGRSITQKELLKLAALDKAKGSKNNLIFYLGIALLFLGFILVGGTYLAIFANRTFNNNKNLLLILVCFILAILFYEITVFFPVNLYLLPISSLSMLISILLGVHPAFITAVVISLVMGLFLDFKITPLIIFLLCGSLGIILVRNARRRFEILNAGFLVGLLKFVLVYCLSAVQRIPSEIFFKDALYGLGSGFLSAFVIMGFLPIFEGVFKITTNITLLELSDLNHPLLKELILKAPGTYHHSLIVGNLAEAACDAIGANSLLARVGAYYHDIGKIEKPSYFSENESVQKSKHGNLVPSMSALIIINHVKGGVELARKYKLNQVIIDFIEQHHGTGLIYYFYQRALENVKDETDLKEEEFRYPGPKAQSKEAAVVLLADSVEASSRTLANPTPSRIEAMVKRIINNKFIDGQLDECDLSLKDLHKIAESFVRILTGIFHSRIEYPDTKPDEGRQNRKEDKKG